MARRPGGLFFLRDGKVNDCLQYDNRRTIVGAVYIAH